MARLPQPGGDTGNWGDILNEYLSVSHASNGNLAEQSVDTDQLHDGAVNRDKVSSAVNDLLEKADSALQDVNGLISAGTNVSISGSGTSGSPYIINSQNNGGDVVGPASSAHNTIVRFNGTTGKQVRSSGVYIDDVGNLGIGGTPTIAQLEILGNAPKFRMHASANDRAIELIPHSGSLDSINGAFHFNRYATYPIAIGYNSTSHLRVGQATESVFGSTALVYVGNTETTTPALVIDKAPSQTADILQIRSDGQTSGADILSVKSNGRLGLGGISEPGTTLHLRGSIRVQNVTDPTKYNDINTDVNGYMSLNTVSIGNILGVGSGKFNLSYAIGPLASTLTGYMFSSGTNAIVGTQDTGIYRLGAGKLGIGTASVGNYGGSLALSNIGIGTDTPTHSITLAATNSGIVSYNTSDQITNYERVRQFWSANAYTIASEATGTGTYRPIAISSPNGSVSISNAVSSLIVSNTSAGITATRSTTSVVSLFDITTTNTGLAGTNLNQYGLRIAPTVSQTGTSGYTMLVINPTESSTGSGTKLLADFQVGGASKFSVDTNGKTTSLGGIKSRTASLIPSSNNYTPNSATTDLAIISNPTANFTIANPSSTADDGQRLVIRIVSGATAYTPSWGSAYMASGMTSLPTTSLPSSKTVTLSFVYDSSIAKWILLAADTVGY